MSLTVTNVSYSVPITAKQKSNATYHQRLLRQKFDPKQSDFKPILKDISFSVKPGEFVGIIGSSGCGKTSLINIICNRLYTKTWSGECCLNDKKIGPWAKKSIGYVQQEDILKSTDTVKEAIEFVADMRLPGNKHSELVDRIITELGLAKIRNSIIGSAAGQGFLAGTNKTGISGGERRRTSIGKQLVSGSEILILDECTSGLDVHTANSIISLLKELSKQPYDHFQNTQSDSHNLTILTTIHQPTSQMWKQFDRILVMKEGEIVFNVEPTTFTAELLKADESLPDGMNPADYLIELLQRKDSELTKLKQVFSCPSVQTAKVQPIIIKEEMTPQPIDIQEVDPFKTLGILPTPGQLYQSARLKNETFISHIIITLHELFHYQCKYVQPYYQQFKILSLRAWRTQYRCHDMVTRFFAQFTIMMLFAGSLWYRTGFVFDDMSNKIGALFFIELCLVFPPCSDACQRWFEKRQQYLQEHAMGLYGTALFFAAESIVDLVVFAALILYATVGAYYMIRFNDSFQLCLLLAAEFYMLMLACLSFALFTTFLFSSFVAALGVYMVTVSILIVFSGPYTNSNSIPDYWIWGQWISVFTYIYRAQFYLMLYGHEVTCGATQCPLASGLTVYQVFGVGGYTFSSATWLAFGYLLGWTCVFQILSYICLRYRRFS